MKGAPILRKRVKKTSKNVKILPLWCTRSTSPRWEEDPMCEGQDENMNKIFWPKVLCRLHCFPWPTPHQHYPTLTQPSAVSLDIAIVGLRGQTEMWGWGGCCWRFAETKGFSDNSVHNLQKFGHLSPNVYQLFRTWQNRKLLATNHKFWWILSILQCIEFFGVETACACATC